MTVMKGNSDFYHEMLRQKKIELANLPAQQTAERRTSVEYTLYENKRDEGSLNYRNYQEVMKREPIGISAGFCPSCEKPIRDGTFECGCS